ncbi:MAG: helix-turn-helix transcriptional regulator [Candidatus Aminicenantes bacterium]|jgi:DNA-binding PadR family transcriptional regulator
MKLLSRPEEVFLLAIWKLQDNAYAVTIRDKVKELTGKTWSFGAVFITLERLTKKKYLRSKLSSPTKKRGGRSKRLYFLTSQGKEALIEIRNLQQSLWADIPELSTRSSR